MSWTLGVGKWRYLLKQIALFVCLTILLAWNYTFNSLDISNIQFETFQADSESLVRGVIIAEHNNIAIPQTGLGLYQDASGTLFGASLNEFVTDENWDHGYSRIAPMVVIENNPYTQKVCREGNYIRFSNGDEIGILATFPYGNYLNVQLDAAGVLTESIYGDLHDIEFLNMQMEPQPKGELYVYPSQFGLQGRVFRSVAKYMDYNTSIQYLKLLCSIGTAGVFCLICFLLYRKYNGLLAGCFYITFLLSPWIVNFARNLYWVEFTWFLPIAVGLLCAIKIDSKRWRFLSYIVGWAAIFIKCLCGYEYLTAIMLGMISFLLADWFEALRHHERQNAKRLFFTVFSWYFRSARICVRFLYPWPYGWQWRHCNRCCVYSEKRCVAANKWWLTCRFWRRILAFFECVYLGSYQDILPIFNPVYRDTRKYIPYAGNFPNSLFLL